MDKIKLTSILALISGLFLSFSLPLYNLGWLSLIGLAPLFLSIKIVKNSIGGFKIGWLTGLVYFLFTFRWFWDAFPLNGFGISSHFLAFVFILFAWFLTALVMSLFWGMAVWLCKKIEPKISPLSLIIFPSIFVVFEYFRSYIMTILWFRLGNPIGPNWTAGNLAYNLYKSFSFLKISSLVGIYGITFLVVLVNVLIFTLIENRSFRKLWLVIVILIISLLPYEKISKPTQPSDSLPIAVIQTAIPSKDSYTTEEQLSFFKKQLELLGNVAHLETPFPSVVVFPEGSNFFTNLSLFGNTFTVSRYFNRLFPSQVVVIDNSRIAKDFFLKSKTIVLNSKTGIAADYDKYLLTPGGEYVPYLFRLIDKLLTINSPALKSVQEFESGSHPPQTIDLGAIKLGLLVCSDVASPGLAKDLAATNSNLLVVQASFGFVNGSKDLISQTQAMASFRAAENNKYLIYASNFGPSYLISGNGITIKKAEKPGFEILTGDVVLNSRKTLYNKAGDWPIILAGLSVVMASIFLRKID